MGYDPNESRDKVGQWAADGHNAGKGNRAIASHIKTVVGSGAVGAVSGGASTAGAAASAVAAATQIANKSKLLRFTGLTALGRATGLIGTRAIVGAAIAAAPIGLATGLAAGVAIGVGVATVRGISNIRSRSASIKNQIATQHQFDSGKKMKVT